jgi:hypothetical protein
MGGTNRFLGTIVEIVSEGRSYLALEFDRRNKTTLIKDEEIPQLRCTKEARKSK